MTRRRTRGLIAAAWFAATGLVALATLDRLAPPDLARAGDLTRAVVAGDGSVLRAFLARDVADRGRDELNPNRIGSAFGDRAV